MRVTDSILQRNFITNLNFSTERLYESENKVLTNKRVNKPSDDPVDALTSLEIRSRISEIKQYQRNIGRSKTILENSESYVTQLAEIFQRLKTLTIQGASGSYGPLDKLSIAGEVNQLIEQIYNLANSRSESIYIFAGTYNDVAPYHEERDDEGDITKITTSGSAGDITGLIGERIKIKVNINGEDLFEKGENIFDLAIKIRDDLRVNDDVSTAEKAEAESDSIEGEINKQGTITIVDNYDSDLNIDYTEGMTLNDIANLINEDAQQDYSEIQESSIVLLQSDVVLSKPIDQNTTIGEIRGITTKEGDTISITGTDRQGHSITRIITLESSDSHTIQDILDAIVDLNDNEVSASIDTEGHIVIQDNTSGVSQMSLSIETTISGLDFGDFITTQKGRERVSVNATVTDDNRLKISHNSYGSEKTFTISGAAELGIADNEYAGIDVAGAISENLNVINEASEKIYNTQALLGSKLNRIEAASTRAYGDIISFTEFLSNAEDVDSAEAIMDYQRDLLTLQVTLQAGARIMFPTLADFLR